MRTRLAVFALSLAFAICLTPGLAIAAEGDSGLATGELSLTTMSLSEIPSQEMTVSPSTCYLGTGQKAKIKAVFEKTYMGSVSSRFNWSASYYGHLTVSKNGKALVTKDVKLTVGDGDDYMWYEGSFNFKPTATGTYKVRFSFMDGSNEMDSFEKTFKVKKVTALKSYKPAFSVGFGFVGDDAFHMLSGLNGKTQIYRATSKNGKYKLITTTTKATYKDKKAKAGKEYWYKTRIIGKSGSKTYKSKLSAAKSEPMLYGAPNAPTITSANATSVGVELKWKRPSKKTAPYGCYFYVQRSTKKNSGYEDIASIRQDNDRTLYLFDGVGELSSNSAYVDTTARPGKTYYYRVRAGFELKWTPKDAYSYSAPVQVKV